MVNNWLNIDMGEPLLEHTSNWYNRTVFGREMSERIAHVEVSIYFLWSTSSAKINSGAIGKRTVPSVSNIMVDVF